MAYPSSLDNLVTNYSDSTPAATTHAAAHDAADTAINAVQAELGLLPKGSYASVRARLDAYDVKFAQIQSVTNPYTISNNTTRRSIDVSSYTMDQLAQLVGTLVGDLKIRGILG